VKLGEVPESLQPAVDAMAQKISDDIDEEVLRKVLRDMEYQDKMHKTCMKALKSERHKAKLDIIDDYGVDGVSVDCEDYE
jgi:hypothetical protein